MGPPPPDIPAPESPNIVMIVADDMGACDLGFYGNPDAETPNLDSLAKSSLRHEAFYVASVCAPTRASLLTGRHHLRTGVSGVHGGLDFLHQDEVTIADTVRTAAYATGIWGKWHSGSGEGYEPQDRGFDEALKMQLYRHRDPRGEANGKLLEFPGKWADDVIVDACLEFFHRHRKQPVFAVVTSMTPHGRLDAPEEEVARFMEKGMSRKLALLHAQMHLFDRAVGRLRKGLEEIDTLGRPTVVLFLSDNGPAMFENDFTDADRSRRNRLGWRGWKGDVWENGVRSPLFISWPGRFAPATILQPADVTDLLPTLAAWAGASRPANAKPLDGRDITPMLLGKPMSEKPVYVWTNRAFCPADGFEEQRALLNEYRPQSPEEIRARKPSDEVVAVRAGRWKLTRNAAVNTGGGPAPDERLADIPNDPKESRDLKADHPAEATRLAAGIDEWWSGILKEPHAFRTPVLTIPPEGEVELRASFASRISPILRKEMMAVEGFESGTAALSWPVTAVRSRSFLPVFKWWKTALPPAGSKVAVTCSGSKIVGMTGEDGGIAWEGVLNIDAGPCTLEVAVTLAERLSRPLSLFSVTLRTRSGELSDGG